MHFLKDGCNSVWVQFLYHILFVTIVELFFFIQKTTFCSGLSPVLSPPRLGIVKQRYPFFDNIPHFKPLAVLYPPTQYKFILHYRAAGGGILGHAHQYGICAWPFLLYISVSKIVLWGITLLIIQKYCILPFFIPYKQIALLTCMILIFTYKPLIL